MPPSLCFVYLCNLIGHTNEETRNHFMATLFVTVRVAFQRSQHWRMKYSWGFFGAKIRCVPFLFLEKSMETIPL